MAYSQSDLTAIEAAIKTGTLSVEIDGRKVTYRSLGEMSAIRAMIKKDVDGVNQKPTITYASFGRG